MNKSMLIQLLNDVIILRHYALMQWFSTSVPRHIRVQQGSVRDAASYHFY